MNRVRVVVADDHTLLREGIRALLAGEGDLEIVAEAADGAQAQKFVEKLKPDILLLDPLLLKGPQTLQRLREKSP
ncbi:MAG TPA: response regulator, partial [Candidatus Methylomirabilis sp.]|nr:response regulator [Candidatus Methylomirabilis sp.]